MATSAGNPFMKHIYTGSGPPSESQSEISSVDSDWSDLKMIAAQLGVINPDDLVTERFRIDRTKLENMIKTETNEVGMNCAEKFFDDIVKETNTYIGWPCRLKLGAKTKKDPHVRIVGKPNDVLKAKERVTTALDARVSQKTILILLLIFFQKNVFFVLFLNILGKSSNYENGCLLYGSLVHYWSWW